MKKEAPEKFRHRVVGSPYDSDHTYGMNGVFIFPRAGILLFCIVSDEAGWEHVSVSLRTRAGKHIKRCPTWEEMCHIKSLFWDDDEAVFQIHPPLKNYINNHNHCLHLWKPIGRDIELPHWALVGVKQEETV